MFKTRLLAALVLACSLAACAPKPLPLDMGVWTSGRRWNLEVVQANKIAEGLAALSRYGEYGLENVRPSEVIAAFPDLRPGHFIPGHPDFRYTHYALRAADFDGAEPFDYVLLLRERDESGPYLWYVVLRSGNRVTYQYLPGFVRGYFNTRVRAERRFNQGVNAEPVKRYMQLSGYGGGPRDVDGDGFADLIQDLMLATRPCLEEGGAERLNTPFPVCGSLTWMAGFSFPYFIAGEDLDRLEFDPARAGAYYREVEAAMAEMDVNDRRAVRDAAAKARAGELAPDDLFHGKYAF